uniref:Uncharacterized protein n=1 Tax=viral metagenome TaxID=1070528 RepID=A0A6M3L4S3_9ZZZZ
MREQIKIVRAEIFRLALRSKDIETMHWYMWLDDCFENDEFYKSDFGKMKWRIWVLMQKNEPVIGLSNMITPILKYVGVEETLKKQG